MTAERKGEEMVFTMDDGTIYNRPYITDTSVYEKLAAQRSAHYIYPTTFNHLTSSVFAPPSTPLHTAYIYQLKELVEIKTGYEKKYWERIVSMYKDFATVYKEDRLPWLKIYSSYIYSPLSLMDYALPESCWEGRGWKSKFDGVHYIFIPEDNKLKENTVENLRYWELVVEWVDSMLTIAECQREGRRYGSLTERRYVLKEELRGLWGVTKDFF